MKLKCKNPKCKHEWNYRGKSKIYACCPKCLYKVNINKQKMKYCNLCKNAYEEKSNVQKYCLGCKRIKIKEWDKNKYLKNREKIIKRTGDYSKNNRKKINIYHKKYYKRNRKRICKYMGEYRKEHLLKIRAIAKKSSDNPKHRKRRIEKQTERRNTDIGRIKMKEENKRRRFSKHIWFLKNKGYNTPDKLKKQIIEKFKDIDKCFYCDSSEKLAIDHIMPLTKSGTNDIWNLIIACKKCNSSKSNKNPFEWAKEKSILLPKEFLEKRKENEN